MRRFEAGQRFNLHGVHYRIEQGRKYPGDLVLVRFGRMVRMEETFLQADFFTENEREMRAYKSGWRFNGDAYFMDRVWAAVRDGWETEAQRLTAQRERLEA